ncbi:MAG: hypothetical protein ACYSTT_10585 [Planctomycetota bacterium]|jgi:hypothetical protein
MSENNHHIGFVPLMPDGTPAPAVMLEQDLIRFLRLKELGIRNPQSTLRYYRERGKLHATKLGNRNCYTVQSAVEFLKEMTTKKI